MVRVVNIIACKQHSPEWWAARLGKPTASRFSAIVTPLGRARGGATARRYALDLLGERITMIPATHHETDAMLRGAELEPRGRAWYQLATGRVVREVGFVVGALGRWGCSPDGLTDDGRGLEIKCPLLPMFLDIAESGCIPDDHRMQIQAALWITGLPAWDYCLYTDARGLVPQIITVEPDPALHAAMAQHVPEFCSALDDMEQRMRAAGHGVMADIPQEAHDDIDNPFA